MSAPTGLARDSCAAAVQTVTAAKAAMLVIRVTALAFSLHRRSRPCLLIDLFITVLCFLLRVDNVMFVRCAAFLRPRIMRPIKFLRWWHIQGLVGPRAVC